MTKRNMLYTSEILKHASVFWKVDRVIKFNQNAWLKPYIDMNTDLRKKEFFQFSKRLF